MRLLTSAALLLALTLPAFAENHVALPKDYKETFVEYMSLDRTLNPDQFIRLYANKIAMLGKDSEGKMRNGSVLVAEVYSVKKNPDGSVKTSALKRRIQDELLLLAVMERQEGFSKTSGSPIHTGEWDFGAYKPNGEVAPKNLDSCRGCHTPLVNSDFLFSIEHLPAK